MDLILLEFGNAALTSAKGNDAGASEGSLGALTDNPGNLGFDHSKCVELVSISQGIKQQITTDGSNSARTSGRPVVSDFTCVKYVDATSPKLYEYCLSAKLLDAPGAPCRIHVLRNSGDRLNLLMQFKISNVLISEIDFQSHPNDMATEHFKLNFTEISWLYCSQGPGMQDKEHVATGWNIARNRPITPGA